jgi:thiol-disulfide isomerase/thioredoxin
VAITLLLLACGGAATALPAPNSAAAILVTDFQVQLYHGEEVLGGKDILFSRLFAQGQPVVLNFFAGLCPPCRAEMPDFQAVSTQYQGRVTFFGLDIGPFVRLGSRQEGAALVQELGITYPTGTTFDVKVVPAYQVLGMPTTVFLTPDGKIFKSWTGLLTRAKMVELTEQLLKASGK